jgi:hypothetical protein
MSSPTNPTPPSDPEASPVSGQQTQIQSQSQTQQNEAEPVQPGPSTKFDISEEYGTARKNLPPAGVLAICLVAVMVIVTVFALTNRAHPLSSGSIDDVVSVAVPQQDMVMVAINVTLHNNAKKPSWIHTIKATLDTGKDKFDDDASPAVDAERYFKAFPDLKAHALPFLMPEQRLDPKSKTVGTFVVSFPVSAEAFAARKSLIVTVAPYDEVPLEIKK